jgi:TrkA-C domain
VLAAIGRQITTGKAQTAQAQASADRDDADQGTLPQNPPTPLPGYQITEIAITAGSPAAGRKLSDVTWPPGSTPVTVLRGRHLRPPLPELTLASGDRVSLLIAAPAAHPKNDPGGGRHAQPAAKETGHHM